MAKKMQAVQLQNENITEWQEIGWLSQCMNLNCFPFTCHCGSEKE
jgi:hypothetical protein